MRSETACSLTGRHTACLPARLTLNSAALCTRCLASTTSWTSPKMNAGRIATRGGSRCLWCWAQCWAPAAASSWCVALQALSHVPFADARGRFGRLGQVRLPRAAARHPLLPLPSPAARHLPPPLTRHRISACHTATFDHVAPLFNSTSNNAPRRCCPRRRLSPPLRRAMRTASPAAWPASLSFRRSSSPNLSTSRQTRTPTASVSIHARLGAARQHADADADMHTPVTRAPTDQSFMLELFISCVYLASAVGAIGGSYITPRWGRRATIGVGACCFLVGAALQGGAVHVSMLILGRLALGLGEHLRLLQRSAPPRCRAELRPAALCDRCGPQRPGWAAVPVRDCTLPPSSRVHQLLPTGGRDRHPGGAADQVSRRANWMGTHGTRSMMHACAAHRAALRITVTACLPA